MIMIKNDVDHLVKNVMSAFFISFSFTWSSTDNWLFARLTGHIYLVR